MLYQIELLIHGFEMMMRSMLTKVTCNLPGNRTPNLCAFTTRLAARKGLEPLTSPVYGALYL